MAKTQSFISNSRMLLKDGKTVERGELLKLEVGDDNLPTEQIYRDRVSAVKDNSEAADKGDAKKIVADAKAEAKKIIEDAQKQANEILSKAANGQK